MAYQGNRRRALCKIMVMGEDVTRAFDPHLISVQTISRSGDKMEGDAATIELDDRDGKLAIPPNDADLEVWLGWANESMGIVWKGIVQEVESGFSRRGGGRRLWIEAKGFDGNGLGRAHFRQAWGDGEGEEVKLAEVLQKAARAAGLSVKISPSMAKIARKYWAQNESFHHFGARLARELGGVFKVTGDVATMVHATDGLNAEGEQMGSVEAVWGENLIGWRIKPFSAMPQAEKAASVMFDRTKGAWEGFDKAIGGSLPFGLSKAIASLPAPAPNKQTGEQWNVGLAEGSLANRGCGSVIVNGEPAAQPMSRVKVEGARAGVDGEYSIEEVEHVYSRSGGFITRLSVNNPNPTANAIIFGEPWGWVGKTPRQYRAELNAQTEAERAQSEREGAAV